MRRTTALVLALASCLTAQAPYDLDKTGGGTLGGAFGLAVRNAPPSSLMTWGVSATAGPTPLSLFDPTDPRSLALGTDLASFWFFAVTSATGTANLGSTIPNTPSLAGWRLHWQTAIVPGQNYLVGRLSNDVVTQFGVAGTPLAGNSALATARAFATALWNRRLNAGAADVVVAGGGNGTLTAATGLQSSEVFAFRTHATTAGPNLTVARALHTATELLDGRYLLAGGADGLGAVTATCEIYDPATNSFTATAPMATPRILHAAARLPDGRVLVAGGTSSLVDVTTAITSVLASAEIWNPTTGLWTSAAAIGGPRLGPALTTLSTGRVMCSGGVQVGFLFGIPISASSVTTVQLYNPTTNSWAAGAAMPQARAGHQYNQVTLNDNRVLMSGGVVVPSLLGATNATPTNGAEVYNPATNTWTVANMAAARSLHSATLLADGRVAVCGGAQGTFTAPLSIDGVEVFNPATNSFAAATPLLAPRAGQAAVLLPDGILVLLGGQDAIGSTAAIETLHF